MDTTLLEKAKARVTKLEEEAEKYESWAHDCGPKEVGDRKFYLGVAQCDREMAADIRQRYECYEQEYGSRCEAIDNARTEEERETATMKLNGLINYAFGWIQAEHFERVDAADWKPIRICD